MTEDVLRLSHLEVAIRGNTVFSDLSLCLYHGETVCLPCLSAAQQDALCRVLSGRLQPLSGWVFVGSSPQQLLSPVDALEKGIFCILKESALFDTLSISENLFCLPSHKHSLLLHRAKMAEKTQHLLNAYAPSLLANATVATLAPFQRHLLELVKAVHAHANVIVYDHDLSQYSETEYAQITRLFHYLNLRGIAVLCMSANLNRAALVADRIVAVREKTALKAFDRPFSLAQITQCLLGFAAQEEQNAVPSIQHTGNALFSARRMRVPSFRHAFDLTINAGEIIGIIDITHRIADDILAALAGKLPHWEHALTLYGASAALRTSEESFRRGVLLVDSLSSDNALFQSMTVEQNIQFIALRRTSGAACCIRKRFLSSEVRDAARAVGLKKAELHEPISPSTVFRTQLARIRLSFCRMLLLQHPFSGLHMSEQNILRTFIRDCAGEGNGIVISATDIRYLADLCTRFYVITPDGLYERFADQMDLGGIIDA